MKFDHQQQSHRWLKRFIHLFLVGLTAMAALGMGCGSKMPAPAPGAWDYQAQALMLVPGASVNVAGGNLLVRRSDLDLDTHLGNQAVTRAWNGSTGQWLWNFDVTYDGAHFVDASGAVYPTSELSDGETIPGSTWVRVNGQAIQSKGGRLLEFDAAGQLAAIRWASADYPRLKFGTDLVAGSQRMTAIEQCMAAGSCTSLYSMSYDGLGQLIGVGDHAGRNASYTWNPSGELTQARDGLDLAESWTGELYEYSTAGDLSAITNSEGERVAYTHNGARRVTKIQRIGLGDPSMTISYAKVGGKNRATVAGSLSEPKVFLWDNLRRVVQVEDGVGDFTMQTWNELRPVTRTAPSGELTTWAYLNDDIATRTEPSGNVVNYVYATSGVDRAQPERRPMLWSWDSLGILETREYDSAGRLVSMTNGAGEATALAYSTDETIASVTSPSGSVLSFAGYGIHGHPTSVTSAVGTDARTYDLVGNLLKGNVIGSSGSPGHPGVVSRTFDADRNISSVVMEDLPIGLASSRSSIGVTWRSDQQRKSISRPYGGNVEFIYDALGSLTERREWVDGSWHSDLFEHDLAGRLTAHEQANGMREERTYDAAGQIVGIAYRRGGNLEAELQAIYQDGRLISKDDATYAGIETYAYDAAGRVSRIGFPQGEAIDFEYDLRSRDSRMTYRRPDDSVLQQLDLEYDAAGRLNAVRGPVVDYVEADFSNGRIAQQRFGNGLVRNWNYHPTEGHLSGFSMADAQGQPVESTSINRTNCPGVFGLAPCLKQTTSTSIGVIATTEESYSYGAGSSDAGTRLSFFSSNGFTQLVNSQLFGYDELNNMTKNTDLVGDIAPTYNSQRNRVHDVRDGGAVLASYTYDAAGYVTSRSGVPMTWTASGLLASYGTGTHFVWDAEQRPVQATIGGSTQHWSFGGKVSGASAGQYDSLELGAIKIDLANGQDLYRHGDFRKNVKLVTDHAGQVATHYHFNGYGVLATHGSHQDRKNFARGTDLGGLTLLGVRVLDPLAARFLSPDPVYQLANQFAYADGNPVNFWDPGGTVIEWSIELGVEFEIDVSIRGKGGKGRGSAAVKVSGDGKADGGGESSGDGGDSSGNEGPGDSADGADGGPGGSEGGTVGTSGIGGSGGFDIGGIGVCSPAALTSTPDLAWTLMYLIPVQVLLGALLLGRTKGGDGSDD